MSVGVMLVAAIISGVVGLAIALLATPAVIRVASQFLGDSRTRDLHHTHKKPVPRLGGLVLALAFLGIETISWFLRPASLPGSGSLVIILSCLAMFALGFWDDLRPVGARYKLVGQALISLGVWFSGIGVTLFSVPLVGQTGLTDFWSALLTVLWLVGMTNLINLIDGVDGLAGGICLMLMLLSCYVGFHNPIPALLAAGMTGALIGFLRYNFPPARIYLGDGGAYFLGFQIGLLALVNSQKGTIAAALIAPLFVLALPIVDTALAILRRGLRGLPIFRPDKRHIHHRLLGSGLTRRQVVLSIYSFTAVFMILGLIAFWSKGKLLPVLVGVAMLILLLCAGNLKFSREWFAVGRVVGNSLEMRQEIRYALAMVRWLELEGTRCSSVDELCESFLFCARRFGFTSVRLSLAGLEKEWGESDSAAEGRVTSIDLPCRIPGKLVLSAPKAAEQAGGSRFVVTIADSSVFEILSELLAEGWIKAANRSHLEPGASPDNESALARAGAGTMPPAATRTRPI
jgi:UDP-GlcNAc:undecaprenyl-phosphate GlcNAc-1-phosphate transferase